MSHPNHQKSVWYLHVNREVFGPLDARAIAVILEQDRASFADHVWTEGFLRWERICDVDLFAALAPSYPSVRPPEPGSIHSAQPPERRFVRSPERWSEPPKPLPRGKAKVRRDFEIVFSELVEVKGWGAYSSSNLREGGIYLLGVNIPPLGSGLILSFRLPDGAVEVGGRVTRLGEIEREKRGFAVEFTDLPGDVRLRIQEFILRSKRG
ncbi:MAG: PilZ domain-containing protein [Bdellovibrionales bacterium]|nr:PilZ domain-containing protein [Bdellovibrionales bacterium]